MLWLRQFLLGRRRQEEIFPSLTICAEHISTAIGLLARCHPFSPASLWPLPWASCSGVKAAGVYEQPATENRVEKDQSFEEAQVNLKLVIERVGEGREAVDPVILAGKRMFWESSQVSQGQSGQWRCGKSWAGDYREDVGSCSWKWWLNQMDMTEVLCARVWEKSTVTQEQRLKKRGLTRAAGSPFTAWEGLCRNTMSFRRPGMQWTCGTSCGAHIAVSGPLQIALQTCPKN